MKPIKNIQERISADESFNEWLQPPMSGDGVPCPWKKTTLYLLAVESELLFLEAEYKHHSSPPISSYTATILIPANIMDRLSSISMRIRFSVPTCKGK
ncbi:MAG TPA: hypothetical protein VFX02_01905 [Gammaproteobacteria bacterium]|nr:hypothetical protein [Gammaproteobacteria bacterium]